MRISLVGRAAAARGRRRHHDRLRSQRPRRRRRRPRRRRQPARRRRGLLSPGAGEARAFAVGSAGGRAGRRRRRPRSRRSPGSEMPLGLLLVVAPLPDADGDGVPDAIDNCPTTPNPDQASTRRRLHRRRLPQRGGSDGGAVGGGPAPRRRPAATSAAAAATAASSAGRLRRRHRRRRRAVRPRRRQQRRSGVAVPLHHHAASCARRAAPSPARPAPPIDPADRPLLRRLAGPAQLRRGRARLPVARRPPRRRHLGRREHASSARIGGLAARCWIGLEIDARQRRQRSTGSTARPTPTPSFAPGEPNNGGANGNRAEDCGVSHARRLGRSARAASPRPATAVVAALRARLRLRERVRQRRRRSRRRVRRRRRLHRQLLHEARLHRGGRRHLAGERPLLLRRRTALVDFTRRAQQRLPVAARTWRRSPSRRERSRRRPSPATATTPGSRCAPSQRRRVRVAGAVVARRSTRVASTASPAPSPTRAGRPTARASSTASAGRTALQQRTTTRCASANSAPRTRDRAARTPSSCSAGSCG